MPQLKNLNFKIWQIPLQSLFVAVSVITKIIYSVKAYTVIFPVIGICIAVPRGGAPVPSANLIKSIVELSPDRKSVV